MGSARAANSSAPMVSASPGARTAMGTPTAETARMKRVASLWVVPAKDAAPIPAGVCCLSGYVTVRRTARMGRMRR